MAEAAGLGPMTEIALDGRAKSGTEFVLRWIWWGGIAILSIMVLTLAWLVTYARLYTPGDGVGYNLGLAGGIMMLTLLLYPLRKRLRSWGRLGGMRPWFRYHMVMGIAGPVLVLFHSTFKTGSMNGSVALYSTLLVCASGIIGRFVYRHIHRGLYGRKLTLAETEQDLTASANDMRSVIGLAPEVGEKLREFQTYATQDLTGFGARARRFMTVRWRGRQVTRSVYQTAKVALKRAARKQRWTRVELRLHWRLAKGQIRTFVDATCASSQFSTWEWLFSLWHIAHVPFIYLLVVCGIVHVVAVHMY
jgi:hypothetical protein